MFNLENPFRKKEPAKKDFFGVPEKPKTDAELAMEAALARAEEGVKKSKEEKEAKKPKLSPELQKIKDEIDEKIESGDIQIKEIVIGGKDKDQLEKELIAGGNKIDDDAKLMLNSEKFETLKESENIELIILSVADLGFPNGARTDEIYKRAKEMGLEIAPVEIGPQLRIQYADQPMGENLRIGMEPFALASGLGVFRVNHGYDGRYLDDNIAYPAYHWRSSDRWVFRRPPSSTDLPVGRQGGTTNGQANRT